MMLAGVFGIVHMIHQVVFTTMFVQLLHSAGTVEGIGTQQHIQIAFLHLAQLQGTWKDIIILVNNFAADGFFIYRCYVIWSGSPYRRWVIGVPLLLLLSTTIYGITTTSLFLANVPLAPFFLNGSNIVVVSICVRYLQVIGEPKLVHRYKTAIKMLFESSLLYFVIVLVFLSIQIFGSPVTFESPVIALFSGASPQLMNIMPTLMIVRVSLARSVDADPTAANRSLTPFIERPVQYSWDRLDSIRR
ncbi:hypothetical protein B0H13DRAFT_2130935 [Mycena leptocephala]|nr:hypothetical protein B0H13DRAFT_2130935 [Mycena leptocephala]